MRGIDYVVDETGKQKAVIIDLTEHAEIWEDFYDSVLAEQRKHEPRETLAEVKAQLGLSGG